MSDLPPEQCALPCHGNLQLPSGAEEVRRGDAPSGRVHLLTVPATEQRETRDTRKRFRKPKLPRLSCRHDADTGEWVTPEHTRDCRAVDCEGCRPCGKDHCALFGSCPNHVDTAAGVFTCPSCIGECRSLVAENVTLASLVEAEVQHARVTSAVLNLAGPSADVENWELRRARAAAADEARGWCDFPMLYLYDVDDTHHPVAVFARWERNLRREYEMPRAATEDTVWPMPHHQERDVMSRSAAFFDVMLDGRFAHDEPFEEFFRAMRRLHTYLESVLSDSRKPETGAPCPSCADELHGTDQSAPRLEKHHVDHDKSGASDEWVCPRNTTHRWQEADYRLRVAGDYLAHATTLTADQIHEQYGIPAGTVRRWANVQRVFRGGEYVEQPAMIRTAGRTPTGVKTYHVDEVLNVHRSKTKGETA